MKKLIALIIMICTVMTVVSACAKKEESKKSDTPVRVLTLKGPTGMGMAPLISDSKSGKTELKYDFTVASGADEFTGNIIRGDFEVAAVPTNLAAVLYQKTEKKINIAAINTLGVLYILENGNSVESVYDLEGKTVFSSGLGAVPEYAVNYILSTLGVNCEIIYEPDHDTVVSDLISGKADMAILPEPKVSAAMLNPEKPEGLRRALDVNELWEEANGINGNSGELAMGCIIVNSEWAKNNKEEYDTFLKEYKASIDFVNENHEEAAKMMEETGIIPKAKMAEAAIVPSNIVYIDGEQMKSSLDTFFGVLYSFDKKSVGGAIPDDDIYMK